MDESLKKELYGIMDSITVMMEKEEESSEFYESLNAKRENATKIMERVLNCSINDQIDGLNISTRDWLQIVPQIIKQMEDPFKSQNKFDKKFMSLIHFIWSHTKDELTANMIKCLYKKRQNPLFSYIRESLHEGKRPLMGVMIRKFHQWERPSWLVRLRLEQFLAASSFWGTYKRRKDYTTFELRSAVLKQHSYDFLWLYRRLEDYSSKRTLYAILKNWVFLDMECLRQVKSIFPDYWEPDIFPDNKDDVFVDCGAYTGDSVVQYVQMYGDGYRKIYTYEIAKESYVKLCSNMKSMQLHDVINRCKGTGKERGEMFIDSHVSYSGNHLSHGGSVEQKVEVVPLDKDVDDIITFLKMDIEGAEWESLLGCRETIQKHHPKLAICVYHGYNDIWRIPLLINSMYSNYHFYLRYNGEELFPTEYVLLCKS